MTRDRILRLLDARLDLGKLDHRWDSYSADRLILEAQEELMDSLIYLEELRDRLAEEQSDGS